MARQANSWQKSVMTVSAPFKMPGFPRACLKNALVPVDYNAAYAEE